MPFFNVSHPDHVRSVMIVAETVTELVQTAEQKFEITDGDFEVRFLSNKTCYKLYYNI